MIVGSQVTERHVRGHTASNDEASLTPTASDCRCGFATSLLSSLFPLSVDT